MSPTPSTLSLSERALAMDEDRISLLLTLADEPELILTLGGPLPAIDPRDLAAARLANAWMLAGLLNAAMDARPSRTGAALRAARYSFDEVLILLGEGETLH